MYQNGAYTERITNISTDTQISIARSLHKSNCQALSGDELKGAHHKRGIYQLTCQQFQRRYTGENGCFLRLFKRK